MSVQLTSESLNQWLSMSSLVAVIAGAPPEVALGALSGAVILLPLPLSIPLIAGFSCRCSVSFAAFSSTNRQHQFLSVSPV